MSRQASRTAYGKEKCICKAPPAPSIPAERSIFTLQATTTDSSALSGVIAQSGEPCEVVPEFSRLIEHMNGGELQIPDKKGHPERLVTLMETEMRKRQSLAGAQVLDTVFVSNDHEGHIWWVNIDGSCPTRARLVRTSSSEQDFDALHQRIRESLDDVAYYQAWTDDGDDDKRIFIGWTDECQLRHAYIVYYFTATRQLVIERADGEEPFSICIPHYRYDWFR